MRKHWVEFISVIDSIPPFINFIFAIVKTNAAIMGSSKSDVRWGGEVGFSDAC